MDGMELRVLRSCCIRSAMPRELGAKVVAKTVKVDAKDAYPGLVSSVLI